MSARERKRAIRKEGGEFSINARRIVYPGLYATVSSPGIFILLTMHYRLQDRTLLAYNVAPSRNDLSDPDDEKGEGEAGRFTMSGIGISVLNTFSEWLHFTPSVFFTSGQRVPLFIS